MDEKTKMTAAVAAVMAYMRSEEDALLALGGGQPKPETPPAQVDVWAVSGRQAMMQMRSLMQMKAFHGVRFR
jgi:hypothetical protein